MLVHLRAILPERVSERQQCRGEDQRTQGDAGGCHLVGGLCTCSRRVNPGRNSRGTHHVRRQRACSATTTTAAAGLTNAATGRWLCFKKAETATPLERLQGNRNRRTGNGNRQDQVPSTTGSLLRCRSPSARSGSPSSVQPRRQGTGTTRGYWRSGRRAGNIGAGNPRRRPETVARAPG